MVTKSLSEQRFQQALAFGQVAESRIARWLIARGAHLLPVYDIEYETGKGPRLFGGEDGELICPDLLVFKRGACYWIEAKHKTVFSWYRKKRQWETGIDLRHYENYRRVQQQIGSAVWLLFLHECATPDNRDVAHGCPPECPTGLFGGNLTELLLSESHRDAYQRFGRSYPMVYWAHSALKTLAPLHEVGG